MFAGRAIEAGAASREVLADSRQLDTRLRKLDAGQHDVLVLAAAGLKRLGAATGSPRAYRSGPACRHPARARSRWRCPARTIRRTGARRRFAMRGTRWRSSVEHAVVSALGGGCQTPIGALATVTADGDRLDLQAIVISLDGTRALEASARGPARDAGCDRPARGGGPARPGRGRAALSRHAGFVASRQQQVVESMMAGFRLETGT